jgi:lipoyl(octanoyl) transferase
MITSSPFPVVIKSQEMFAYHDALLQQQTYCENLSNTNQEVIWFLEHYSLYTAGSSAKESDFLKTYDFPLFATGRGGKHTYHGPGQRVIYLFLNLNQRQKDLKLYVWNLEEWIIQTLLSFDIIGYRLKNKTGVWVNHPQKGDSKIGAIGVRVSKWMTSHGLSLNVHPNLDHYNGIVPCGLENSHVTSFWDLEKKVTMNDVDDVLIQNLKRNQFLWTSNS